MSNPLESPGVNGSMDLNGVIGLQLPLEIQGSPIIPCRLSTSAGRWSGEPPQAVAYSSALSPTSLVSYICMDSYQTVIGLFRGSAPSGFGRTFSRRSAARKCSKCGGTVVQASTSQSTSPKNSANSSLNEVTS